MSEQAHDSKGHHQSFWLWVMCLTGVDYFSTLGYQPSIAFESAGLLAPLATIVLVFVTLFGALPVYSYVARESPHGHGSIGMLERLMSGWAGKIMVLVLLGFAATDFVITKTLSAADATAHLIENPLYHDTVYEWLSSSDEKANETRETIQRVGLTMFLLVLLGAMFMRGFKEVIGLAVVLVCVYLLLNAIVVGASLVFLIENPSYFAHWWESVRAGHWHLEDAPFRSTSTWAMIVLPILLFPKLALGLSGFETGVAVMPLIKGDPSDTEHNPEGRIRSTRKLLLTAALIMSTFLLTSSVVTCSLIHPAAFQTKPTLEPRDATETKEELRAWLAPDGTKPGEKIATAKDRTLAYIAHGDGWTKQVFPLFGPVFGTIYDISTIVILWFAGASAMAGLLNLVPQYLPRYGMAPEWAAVVRPLVLLFTGVNLLVTLIFKADVNAQGGAYATGVLVLISSACIATVIQVWRANPPGPWQKRAPWRYLLITVLFLYTTIAVIIEKPEGLKIAACFILAILVSSFVSRLRRVKELRFKGFRFNDAQSQFLWQSLQDAEFPVLVPHRPGGHRALAEKERIIRHDHRLTPDVPIVFVEVTLGDVSDFFLEPFLEVTQEEGRILLRVTGVSSVSHVLTAIALELAKVGKPPEIHFGWADESALASSLGFVLFGQGNVPQIVRELLLRAEPNPEKRPRVIVG